LLGGNAFRNTRIGIDYAHSTIYLSGNGKAGSDMNVVGLTLHPEPDGRFTILDVVEVDGKLAVSGVKAGDVLVGVDGAPVTGATMGQVWSLLGGNPGQVRKLVIERGKERMTVEATVQRFLPSGESPTK
jgi:C-terminal processing protease CtpA/Prc